MTPLVPAARPDPDERRWAVVAAIAGLHVLAFVIPFREWTRPSSPEPQGYELVFDSQEAPSSEQPSPAALAQAPAAEVPAPDDAPPGPPAPTPEVAPSPLATTPVPAPAAAATPQPATAPPAPATAAEPPPAPTALAFAPPDPAPSPQQQQAREAPSVPPSVWLQTPDPETPLSLDTTPIMPQPPRPLPAPPPAPRPSVSRPAPAPRPAARPGSAFATLSRPMDLSFAAGPPPPAARSAVGPRALDLRVPVGSRSFATQDPFADIRAAHASEGWKEALHRYWLQHRYYPDQARENGESGTVTLELTVNRSGRVEEVRVVSGSGSQWLDLGAAAVFRNGKLPPFTDEMKEDRLTFPVPIHYILVQR